MEEEGEQEKPQGNGIVNDSFSLQEQERFKSFDLQYHNSIQKIEIDRRKCTIKEYNSYDESKVILLPPNNGFIQPIVYKDPDNLTLIFETKIHLPNAFIEVLINEIKLVLHQSKNSEQNENRNKYQTGQCLNLIQTDPNQFLWKIHDFVIDAKIKSYQSMKKYNFHHNSFKDQIISSKTTFVSTQQRESLSIKNIIRCQRKNLITRLELVFFQVENFNKKLYNNILLCKMDEEDQQNSPLSSKANLLKEKNGLSLSNEPSNVNLNALNLEAFTEKKQQMERTTSTENNYSRQSLLEDSIALVKSQENHQLPDQGQPQTKELVSDTKSINGNILSNQFIGKILTELTQNENKCGELEEINKENTPLQKQDTQTLTSNQVLIKQRELFESLDFCKIIPKKEKEPVEIISTQNILSKKNVVKNIVKAFQRYLKGREFRKEIELIIEKEDDMQYEQFVKKYLSFEKKKSYNNNLIKILMQNEDYSKIFKFFLMNRAKQMLQNSNVSDKYSHFLILDKYIAALQNPYSFDDIISTRKSNYNKKKRSKVLMA